MSLVGVEELKAHMSDISLSPEQEQAAQNVLDGLQAELEAHLGRPVEQRTVTETLSPDARGYIWPTQTPVVSVTSMEDPDGVAVTWSFSDGYYVGLGWPVTVTYVAGIKPPGVDAIRLAILRAATREMTVRHDDTMSVKGLEARNDATPDFNASGWTDEELERLERFRKRVVAT